MNLHIPYFTFECTMESFLHHNSFYPGHAIYFQFVIRFLKKHFVTLCLNADLGNKIQESTQHCWPSWQPQTDIRYISYPFWLSALHNKIGLYAFSTQWVERLFEVAWSRNCNFTKCLPTLESQTVDQ